MKFLKKNVKVIIIAVIGVIIGMLITGGIVFAAGQYNASEVRYDTTTVAGALDNLYNYAKNKSDLAEQMQKPNTWTVGTEYNFGDGVYGQRFTGTISSGSTKTLVNNFNSTLINCGGVLNFTVPDTSEVGQLTFPAGVTSAIRFGCYVDNTSSHPLCIKTADDFSGNYDIWILYTK